MGVDIQELKTGFVTYRDSVFGGVIMLFVSSVFMNTSKDNLYEIESLYGKFDISIALNDVQNMDIVNQTLKEYNNGIMSEGDIVISESISHNLDIYENDIYKLDGKKYKVAQISDDINCILQVL